MNVKKIIIILIIVVVIVGLTIGFYLTNKKNVSKLNDIKLFKPEEIPPNFPKEIELFGFKKLLQNYETTDQSGNYIQSVRQFVSVFLSENVYNQYKVFLVRNGWKIINQGKDSFNRKFFDASKENELFKVYVEEVLDLKTNQKDTVVTLYYFKPKQ